MTTRTYGQFCGIARALEIVGERWALLIVRDLLCSPKRYTDLRAGLPQIPTNVLSTRLKELEQAHVVHRRILPLPRTAVVYELTDYGNELEDIVLRLGAWGARSLADPLPGDMLNPDSLLLALRATFQPEVAATLDLDVTYEVRLGEVVANAHVEGATLEVAHGPADAPDLMIETGPAFRAVIAGEITPHDAIEGGMVQLTGDPALLDRFVDLFHIEPCPVPDEEP